MYIILVFLHLLTVICNLIGLAGENKKLASICGTDMFHPNLTYESVGRTLTLELRTDNQSPRKGFVATVHGIICIKNISNQPTSIYLILILKENKQISKAVIKQRLKCCFFFKYCLN